ncbi:alkyl hydroperoxide reductase/ thiol specific antioxidant/ Mal allergen [Umbelopsis sp. PMI_123]|nr:alkyl hydroperoxide reductase/ thiol specific antioxidant/ Mal allergen [Umbelopsis sp. PMI_123]
MSHPLLNKLAPKAFILKNQKAENVNLAEVIGIKPTVLFFYPKDNTAGCTREVCQFRDSFDVLTKYGATVLGVSSDSVESHQAFASKQKLQFDILSDEKQELRNAYEVPKSMLGMLPGRVTFIIGKDGIIKEVFNSQLDTGGHVKASIKALEAENKV